jgi:hypothetical protein
MGLRLDDRRECRLYIWDQSYYAGEPPVHDHPYNFTSTIIAGELTNVRYAQDPGGEEYVRIRYSPGAEAQRRSDAVRLSPTSAPSPMASSTVSSPTSCTPVGNDPGRSRPSAAHGWRHPN